jgi:hypothetical protein
MKSRPSSFGSNSHTLSIVGCSVQMFDISSLAAYPQNIISVDKVVGTMENALTLFGWKETRCSNYI